jgi:hypothetical protein
MMDESFAPRWSAAAAEALSRCSHEMITRDAHSEDGWRCSSCRAAFLPEPDVSRTAL